MRTRKHLPVDCWPEPDRLAFAAAFASRDDVFDEGRGPGAHLADGTRRFAITGYRRWLGFLRLAYPEDLLSEPADRIAQGRVRAYVELMRSEVRATTVATYIDGLYLAARLIAPERDWRWLRALATRLIALGTPEDRFDRLVPPWLSVDQGIGLMDQAVANTGAKLCLRALDYRDGLLVALLAIWPMRRRSLASLTISRHVEVGVEGINLLLWPNDTKSKRSESIPIPPALVPYVRSYLDDFRPVFLNAIRHDGFWASCKGGPLTGGRLYDIFRARMKKGFDKDCCLHDARRAAATHLSIQAPELIGLIPGVLQHTSLDVAEKHYNLARSVSASRRHGTMIEGMRKRLTLARSRDESD